MSTENESIALTEEQRDKLDAQWVTAFETDGDKEKIEILFNAIEVAIGSKLTSGERVKYRPRLQESYRAAQSDGQVFLEMIATGLLENRATDAKIKR
jgi:hypothetical protein